MLVKYVLSDGISPEHFQEVRGIFVIKAAVEMQNNMPFCD
jgi:hypothetical protein